MSFLKKLFGAGSFDDHRAEGDERFARGDYGGAKLAYDKALAKTKDVARDAVSHVERRVIESLDALARARVEEAERFVKDDELELARSELESAREIAATRALKDDITKRLERLEQTAAREAADDVHEASDDELYAALAGTWDEEQADEYDGYGETFRKAYLALHARDHASARPILEALVEKTEEPRYLWFEVARARLFESVSLRAQSAAGKPSGPSEPAASGDAEGAAAGAPAAAPESADAQPAATGDADATPAQAAPGAPERPAADVLEGAGADALRKFLSSIGPDEGGMTRVSAHVELARIASGHGDDTTAEKEMRAATDAMPHETGPWLALGRWLRARKRLADAREALREGTRVMSEQVPDWMLLLELGLLERDAGNASDAARLLQSIIEHDAGRGRLDFAPEVAVPLAEIYEGLGEPKRAADLWRHLAAGSDVQGHFRYHEQAARLLEQLGERAEARRMLLRAVELAADEQARQAVEAKLLQLGGEPSR